MAMVVVDDSSYTGELTAQVWGSAAAWRCSTFVIWAK